MADRQTEIRVEIITSRTSYGGGDLFLLAIGEVVEYGTKTGEILTQRSSSIDWRNFILFRPNLFLFIANK